MECRGGVRERPNRHDWKSCVGKLTVGSNPTASAKEPPGASAPGGFGFICSQSERCDSESSPSDLVRPQERLDGEERHIRELVLLSVSRKRKAPCARRVEPLSVDPHALRFQVGRCLYFNGNNRPVMFNHKVQFCLSRLWRQYISRSIPLAINC